VLALDPATRTGFAFGRPDGKPEIGSVAFGREHDVLADCYGRAVRWWRTCVWSRRAHALVIEPPIPPGELWGKSNYQSTQRIHGLHAIFIGLASEAKMVVLEAPTQTWRKYFLGDGRMKREQAKLAAVRLCRALKWGDPLTLDDNAADAAGMWAYGCAKLAPTKALRVEPLFLGGAR